MIQLRPHQNEAADAIEDAWRFGTRRPLGNLCVGSGKSLIMGEVGRRAYGRGERTLVLVHRQELAQQDQSAFHKLGVPCGVNAAKLGERTWRGPAIVAMINSVFRNAHAFGPVDNILIDECHLVPHSEAGMYREFLRHFPHARIAGFSGTPFRLQGGSLVEGEGALFDKIVYNYDIIDGIRDGYLVPAFTVDVQDKMDVSLLKVRQGEYTGESQDEQMIAAMDKHIAQLMPYRHERRRWLIFEASVKAARAMTQRLNEWGIKAALVIGDMSDAERNHAINGYRRGEFQALVNKDIATTGFDVQEIDLLVMRFRTKSLNKYTQVIGRLLRTIGGNIEASTAAGKADGLVFDVGGNVDFFGPLDFLRPKPVKLRFVSCEGCGARNPSAAYKCWSCDDPMTKLCPACLKEVEKGTLDCPHCDYDMRVGGAGEERKPAQLLDTPSGAALIASYKTGTERLGGWLPILRIFGREEDKITVVAGSERYDLTGPFVDHVRAARWLRPDENGTVTAVLVPNGLSRKSVLQVMPNGTSLVVPMPGAAE